jgi:hypothetical protein
MSRSYFEPPVVILSPRRILDAPPRVVRCFHPAPPEPPGAPDDDGRPLEAMPASVGEEQSGPAVKEPTAPSAAEEDDHSFGQGQVGPWQAYRSVADDDDGNTGPPPAPPASGRGDDSAPPRPSSAPAAGAVSCRSARPGSRTSRSAFAGDPPDPDDPLLGFTPYVHQAPRRNSITPERQRAFIAALAATGIVKQAALAIGASLEALYRLRNQQGAEGFSAAWEVAIDRGMMRLEDCALERAIEGEDRPVVSKGQVVTTYRHHDNKLLMFLLQRRRPGRYGGIDQPWRDPRPGSAVYERMRKQFNDEREVSVEEMMQLFAVKASALRHIVQAREARKAREITELKTPEDVRAWRARYYDADGKALELPLDPEDNA